MVTRFIMEPQLRSPHRLPLRFRSGGRCLFGKDQDLRSLFRGCLCFVCRHPNGTFWLHRRYPYPTFHPRIRIDIVRILYRSSGGAIVLLFFQKGGNDIEPVGCRHRSVKYCCCIGALLPLERSCGTADDGRYPLRSSDKYSGTWCCQ